MKFLKAVRPRRLRRPHPRRRGGAAEDGEWLVSGGFAVCDLAQGHRRPRCHCDTTFVAVAGPRRSTIAEVTEIDEAAYEQVKEALVQHLLEAMCAPTIEAARVAAEDKCAYTAELAKGFPAEVVGSHKL